MFDMSISEIIGNVWYILKDELFYEFINTVKSEMPKNVPWDGDDRDPITARIGFICVLIPFILLVTGLFILIVMAGIAHIMLSVLHKVVNFIAVRVKRLFV